VNRDDPRKAQQIVGKYLVLENQVDEEDLEDEAMVRVRETALELDKAGVNVDSLSEEQWREHLLAIGLNTTQVARAMEELAQWGITDDQ